MSAQPSPAGVLAGDARWCVVEGDSAEVTRALPDGRFDALVTDPPSGIAFMGAEWDRDKGGRLAWTAWLAGILGHARRATRDGGRALVWSLPRTSHWTGCAVEDAGWSIETTIAHLFGTGWPKGKAQTKPAQETWWLARTGRSEALNVEACRVTAGGASPSVERRAAAARRGVGPAGLRPGGIEDRSSLGTYTADREGELAGRYPPNLLLSHAAGCVCEGTRRVRVGQSDPRRADGSRSGSTTFALGAIETSDFVGYADPDGTESVESWRCVEGCPVAELDLQSGERPVGGGQWTAGRAGNANAYGAASVRPAAGFGDTGTASRFFPQFPADDPDAPWNEALFLYAAKPSRAERGEGNVHPTVKSIALMRWLIRLVTRPGDVVLDPFGGSGTTGVAALLEGRRVVLVEREPAFAVIARARCTAADGSDWTAPIIARESEPAPAPTGQLSLFGRVA